MRGFTLIELMVAITICAGMLVWAVALVDAFTTSERSIRASAERNYDVAKKQDALSDIVLNIEVGDSMRFAGNTREAEFVSWCNVDYHVQHRCNVVARIDTELVITANGDAQTMWRGRVPAELRYLSDARDGGAWLTSWGEQPVAPIAMAIVTGQDTTVLRIGIRQ